MYTKRTNPVYCYDCMQDKSKCDQCERASMYIEPDVDEIEKELEC
jgi:hypothetical protein